MSKFVTMVLPRKIQIFDQSHTLQSFGPGTVEVPEEFANHYYMKQHGAVVYDHKAEAEKAKAAADEAERKAAIAAAQAELVDAKVAGNEKAINAAQKKLDKLSGG